STASSGFVGLGDGSGAGVASGVTTGVPSAVGAGVAGASDGSADAFASGVGAGESDRRNTYGILGDWFGRRSVIPRSTIVKPPRWNRRPTRPPPLRAVKRGRRTATAVSRLRRPLRRPGRQAHPEHLPAVPSPGRGPGAARAALPATRAELYAAVAKMIRSRIRLGTRVRICGR